MAAIAAAATAALAVSAAPALADSCPNAAARTGPSANLADCRAYEVVTPPDQADDVEPVFWTSADGNMTAFTALGPFAGGLNGGGDGYLATRGAGGWTAHAMAPPGSGDREDPVFVPQDVSDDGQHIIWTANHTTGSHAGTFEVYLGTGRQTAVNMSAGVRVDPDTAVYQGRSSDASHVLFGILSTAYPPGPSQLYDYTGGSARPVGILPGQTTPDAGGAVLGSYDPNYGGGSVVHAVSADGSRIFFESPTPPPALSGQVSNPSGLYVREDGATTTEIDANAIFWGATADGSTVVYTPDDGSGNLGLSTYDVQHEQTTQIVPTSAKVQGVGGISDDLSRIYFVALGDLADGATAGQPNLYLYDSGSATPRFIATVGVREAARFSSLDGNIAGALMSMASADGRLLAFVSSARLTGYDNQGIKEVYLFDAAAATNPIVCISCNTDGAAPLGPSVLQTRSYQVVPGRIGRSQMTTLPSSITVDGRRIFFETPNALEPRDHNGTSDVYEWTGGAAHLISSGTGGPSQFVGATPSGDDVFLATRNSLVPQETRGDLQTIYDARVGGGFPPAPAPETPCEQQGTCQGAPTLPPAVTHAGTVAFSGTGNVTGESSATVQTRKAAFTVRRIGSKARRRLARTGRVTVRIAVTTPAKVTARLRARIGKRTRTVAHASRTAHRAGTVRLSLRLSPAARRVLRRGGRLRVRLVVRDSRVHGARHLTFTLAGAKHQRGR